MKNYYDILGIDKDTEQREIKRAYKSLIKLYHISFFSFIPFPLLFLLP